MSRYNTAMFCRWCRREMAYVHGHAACLHSNCPMYGLNQVECCDGETACGPREGGQ